MTDEYKKKFEEYANPEFNISTLWDKVKYEILEKWFQLVNSYTEYKYYALRVEDISEKNKDMTVGIETLWIIIKDNNSVDSEGEDVKSFINTLDQVIENRSSLNYDGVVLSMKVLATIMKDCGLTNIEWEKADPSRATANQRM